MKYFTVELFREYEKINFAFKRIFSKKSRKAYSEFAKEERKRVNEYYTYYEQIKYNLPKKIMQINGSALHDSLIIEGYFSGKDFELIVNPIGTKFAEYKDSELAINKIVFISATVLKNDNAINNVFWLCDEIYILKDSYEMHILHLGDKGYGEIIIQFKDIEYF